MGNLGNILQEQGKLEEAIEAYKKAISIDPDNADYISTLVIFSKSKANWKRR